MDTNTDKISSGLNDDYCLDLIMNQSKVTKKTAADSSAKRNRLFKTFQILEGTILQNNTASDNLPRFCEYLENRINDVLMSFQKELLGKHV